MDEKLLKVMEGVKASRAAIEQAVDGVFAAGLKNIFLVGCGGSHSYNMPWQHFLDKNTVIPHYDEIAAELMTKDHRMLGAGSLCIFNSKSGDTKEIVAAMDYCHKKGARTMAFVATDPCPMKELADFYFYFDVQESYSTAAFFSGIALALTRILYKNGEFARYEAFAQQLMEMGPSLSNAKDQYAARCEEYGARHAHDPWHLVLGAGSSWGEAYCYAMCIMEEMQWIHTKSVHAAEFFHGTIELVEPGVGVLLFYSEDDTRPLMDRAHKFISGITDQIIVFDTKGLQMPFDEEFRGFVAPVYLATITTTLSKVFERERDHDLNIRRYYRQMEY